MASRPSSDGYKHWPLDGRNRREATFGRPATSRGLFRQSSATTSRPASMSRRRGPARPCRRAARRPRRARRTCRRRATRPGSRRAGCAASPGRACRDETCADVRPEPRVGVRPKRFGCGHLGERADRGRTLGATGSRLEGVDHGGRLDRAAALARRTRARVDVRGDGVVVEARGATSSEARTRSSRLAAARAIARARRPRDVASRRGRRGSGGC